MQVKLYIQLSPSALRFVKPDATAEDLVRQASFSVHKFGEYVQIGEVELEVDLTTEGMAEKAVVALRVEQANIRAKATKEVNDIEGLVQQLLCIENKPSAPDVVGEIVEEFKDIGTPDLGSMP